MTSPWDWPGSTINGHRSGQGRPYAQWFADQLDPSRHLERFRRGVAITFELGESDHHVPGENAREFVSELCRLEPAAVAQLRVQTYPGRDHLAITTDGSALAAALGWLLTQYPQPQTGVD